MCTLHDVTDFVESRSAHVSQITLYLYIKTRAVAQWPKLLKNDEFLTSMKIIRWHIFGACVGDRALFISARLISARAMEKMVACITRIKSAVIYYAISTKMIFRRKNYSNAEKSLCSRS